MTTFPANNSETRFLLAEAQGPRDEQQDAGICLSSSEGATALLVVSDGVGGNSGGRIAARQVTSTAQQIWNERNGELSDPRKDLQTLCRVAHQRINAEGAKLGISPRATIVALYLTPTQAYWIHSGDSRLYHFRAGQLVTRTKDHSILEIMVKQGLVKEEEMGTHPDQGLLTQSLGGTDYKIPTLDCAEVTPEDTFVLCTDGFWERTETEEMAQVLLGPKKQARQLLDQAVKRAVTRNGPKGDNVTAIVALRASEKTSTVTEIAAEATNKNPLRGIRLKTLFLVTTLILVAAIVLLVSFNFASLLPIGQGAANLTIPSPPGTPANHIRQQATPDDDTKSFSEYIEQLKNIKSIPTAP